MIKILYILLFAITINSYGQDLNGKWKLVRFEDDRTFYNVSNDSIFYKKVVERDDNIENIVKKAFKETTIEFTENNYLIMKSNIVGYLNCPYKLDSEKKKIIIEAEKDNVFEWDYVYKSEVNILIITIFEGITLEMQRN